MRRYWKLDDVSIAVHNGGMGSATWFIGHGSGRWVALIKQVPVTAGANPDRLRGDAALAALCGASPVQASSGKTSRHRVNRGGDRAANNALWVTAHVRIISDPRTRAFVARRTAIGNSRREIMRMLQR